MSYFTNYDDKGRLKQVSRPRIIDAPEQWTNFTYDALGRLDITTSPTGNFITKSYKGLETSTTNDYTGITTKDIIDVLGRTIKVGDPTGNILYNYYSNGKIKNVNANGALTQMDYDPAGNQKELDELNSGLNIYTYDAFGNLKEQVDGQGNHYLLDYDIMGRITSRDLQASVEHTTYTYNDDINVRGFGSLIETKLNDIFYKYDYDDYGRIARKIESFQGFDYSSSYTYDTDGNVATHTYPGGFKVAYEYDNDGSLHHVKNADTEQAIWSVGGINYNDQLVGYQLGNGLSTWKTFDDYGFVTDITTANIQDLEYDFNPNTGNLNWRKDHVFNLEEKFTYDELLKTRLESWEVTGLENYYASYFDDGNIFQKSDVHESRTGSYSYGSSAGPHAVTCIDRALPNYLEQATEQTIQYTAFNKTKRIDQFVINSKVDGNNYTYAIEYGPDYARKTSVLFKEYKLYKYKHYVGNYEVEFDAAGNKRELHYISGGDGLFAIYVKNGDADTMYYVHKDHLGSLYCISDEHGSVVETEQGNQQYFSFDPWGRRRNPTTWSFNSVLSSQLFNRGFTGHEHLDLFGLINMNGRTYDPWLGRMLQPDNFVQAAGYSQNYNRYSYAYNNPLKYTDPDGEWMHIAVGAAIGGVLNLGFNAMQGNIKTFGDGAYAFGIGAAAGALAAGVGAGVGTLMAGSGSFGFGVSAGLTASGFGTGAAVGAASGFTSGLLLGTGNSLMQGYNIGQSLGRGLEAGAWGAASGAVIGGITGGIRAGKLGQNYWTGKSELNAVNVKRSLLSGPELDYSFSSTRFQMNRIPRTYNLPGFIDSDNFGEFMIDKARSGYSEVASFEVYMPNSGKTKYYVLPSSRNTFTKAKIPIRYGKLYLKGHSKNIRAIWHTHPSGNPLSGQDILVGDKFNVPIYSIGPHGNGYMYINRAEHYIERLGYYF